MMKTKIQKKSKNNNKEFVKELLFRLKQNYPDANCALHHNNPFQLLVATILSAQCTDKRVNMVTPILFDRFPDAKSMAEAPIAEVEDIIKSTGFFRSKSKNIKLASTSIVDEFNGRVPDMMEKLTILPGVGRKTANVVLGNAFGKNIGVVVDTHVKRISNLLGLTKHSDPVKIEQDLIKQIPQEQWTLFSHYLIHHGRSICVARRPDCPNCFLQDICPSSTGV